MATGTISNMARCVPLRRPALPLMVTVGAMLALLASALLLAQPAAASLPQPDAATLHAGPQQAGGDYDADDDGLIEVSNLAQLHAIRYDLMGEGSPSAADRAAYYAAFPRAVAGMGCPNGDCIGYELVADLDFDTNGNGQADAGDTYWNNGAGWEPMELGSTFDGEGHTIANLYINRMSEDGVGLFGSPFQGRIQEVGVISADVTGRNEVGGLVGDGHGLQITDSYVTGTISGESGIGGLIGDSFNGTITASYATASVSGADSVGGLIGDSHTDAISNSYATGTVAGTDDEVGGLVGDSFSGTISASYATGSVSGDGSVGGLIGDSDSGTLGASYATGAVVGTGDEVGGLVGHSFSDEITASYAAGTVSGDDSVGGLIGDSSRGTISASYATGSLSGDGGDVGGLIGNQFQTTITVSYWDTQTTGQSSSHGGEGKTTSELQSPTGYTGVYAGWNLDLDNTDRDRDLSTGGDDPWDFGTSNQYPALKYGGLDVSAQRGGPIQTPAPPAEDTPLGPPTNVRVNPAGSGLVNVGWDRAPGAVGYTIIAVNIANTAEAPTKSVNNPDATAGQISNLTVGAEYNIYVGSFDANLDFAMDFSEKKRVTVVSSHVGNAGPDAEALESSVVMLDGTAATGSDGSISSYRWEQVINGSRIVSLAGADTARPTFTVPELSNDQAFVFRLTVTYNDGETSQDEVTITGRPTPGVIVSDVSGNTASVGLTAEFYIWLRSRPSSDVVIPVSSSDPSEGVPEQTQVVFTPENWHIRQTVVTRGRNANVQDGVQDYEIILGSSRSSDPLYNGLDIANVAMQGIALEIAAPEVIDPLIANIPATVEPRVTYTGSNLPSFSLAQSPPGMSIDFSLGTITWTPQESDEGRTFDVTVRANDGALFAEISFQVEVVQPEPVATAIQGNVLMVTDPTTTLDGMSVTAMPTDGGALVTLPTLEKAPPESVPERSSSITPMSDVFLVKGSYDVPVELRFPLGQLADGTSLSDVNFYAYTEVSGSGSGVDGRTWSPLGFDRSLEGTEDSPVYVARVAGLAGMGFFGYQSTSPAIPFAANVTGLVNSDIICTPAQGWREDWDNITCTYALDDAVNIMVENFGHGCRWAGESATSCEISQASTSSLGTALCGISDARTSPCVTVEDLAGWIIATQSSIEGLGLGYDKEITVKIHDVSCTSRICFDPNPRILGYVNSKEGRKVLHITDANTREPNAIVATVAHEYFHHAQGHEDTEINGMRLLVDNGKPAHWLSEGTATWFADELYDSLDAPQDLEDRGRRIMEAGLNSRPGSEERRSHQRFSFFKLLSQSCDNLEYEFKNLLNAPADDETGIKNLSGLLDDASCDFGGHLGEERRKSLEAAISYYNYATQFKEKMSLLDRDEPDTFEFDTPHYLFINSTTGNQLDSANFTSGKFNLKDISIIQPAGAYSFKIPEINAGLPAGKVAELTVQSNEVIVSMTGDNAYFIGENTDFPIGPDEDHHIWFSTAVRESSYTYGDTACAASRCLPEIFVTLVNPSLEESAKVEVSFRVRDETTVEPIITSHTTGQQVSERVVEIRGSIPQEARGETGKVVVTANGIRTETVLDSGGNFEAGVVLALGNNRITAQGFTGSAPTTSETVIAIQGVRSSFTGRNALIPSRVVFVLRWDTGRTTRFGTGDRTDIDIYSTDKNGGTIWYRNLREGPGNLDFDDVYGFGPEVVSYRETNDDVYVNGTFDVDVHYFWGRPSTNYTVDVILNEEGVGTRRSYKYQSTVPLTVSSDFQNTPSGSGSSRFNDVLSVSCNAERVCQVSRYDRSKLSIATVGPVQTSAATDRAALVAFYEATGGDNWENIPDDEKWLINDSNSSISGWHGVSTDGEARVIELSLQNKGLRGQIPSALGDLSKLTVLSLRGNGLAEAIPVELGLLSQLKSLDISDNALTGGIPTQLGNLSNLTRLNLSYNRLGVPTGILLGSRYIPEEIPPDLAKLRALKALDLSHNDFAGTIPEWLGAGNVPLEALDLSHNALTGRIPDQLGYLGHLTRLKILSLNDNVLSGPLPPGLGELNHLTSLNLKSNYLDGPIPAGLGDLTNLRLLLLSGIRLRECIPYSLSDVPHHDLDTLGQPFCADATTGPPASNGMPSHEDDIAALLALYQAEESWREPLDDCLGGNDLTNNRPCGLTTDPGTGRVTKLELSGRDLKGTLPEGLNGLTELTVLDLSHNCLEGEIPPALGDLQNLTELNLSNNRSVVRCVPEGLIPGSTGIVRGDYKGFSGSIPDKLGNLQNLTTLDLSHNDLDSIPNGALGKLSNLTTLDLSHNVLGNIPSDLGKLKMLERLYLNDNHLSGSIPPELGNLSSLETLDLSDNKDRGQGVWLARVNYRTGLEGAIPKELLKLSKLKYLDVSDNSLEGYIEVLLRADFDQFSASSDAAVYVDVRNNAWSGPYGDDWNGLEGDMSRETEDISGNDAEDGLQRFLQQKAVDHVLDKHVLDKSEKLAFNTVESRAKQKTWLMLVRIGQKARGSTWFGLATTIVFDGEEIIQSAWNTLKTVSDALVIGHVIAQDTIDIDLVTWSQSNCGNQNNAITCKIIKEYETTGCSRYPMRNAFCHYAHYYLYQDGCRAYQSSADQNKLAKCETLEYLLLDMLGEDQSIP